MCYLWIEAKWRYFAESSTKRLCIWSLYFLWSFWRFTASFRTFRRVEFIPSTVHFCYRNGQPSNRTWITFHLWNRPIFLSSIQAIQVTRWASCTMRLALMFHIARVMWKNLGIIWWNPKIPPNLNRLLCATSIFCSQL